jgi:DNA-binding GntR family transcriptional regulator
LEHASIDEHEQLIKAFTSKNSDAASLIMKQNILRPMQELYEKL